MYKYKYICRVVTVELSITRQDLASGLVMCMYVLYIKP